MAPVSRPIVSILSACLNARSRASCAATSSAVIRPPLYAAAWAASSRPDPCHARRKSFKQHTARTRPLPVLGGVASSPHTLTEAPTYARLRTSQIDRATSSHPPPDERRPTGASGHIVARGEGARGGGGCKPPESAARRDRIRRGRGLANLGRGGGRQESLGGMPLRPEPPACGPRPERRACPATGR